MSSTSSWKGNTFMFAMECASRRRECGCSSFDVETINNEFRYNGWYRATFIAILYARQAIPRISRRYIYITSQVQYRHDIKGEGHIVPNTTKYDHIRTFTSKQIKLTWYKNQIKLTKQRRRRGGGGQGKDNELTRYSSKVKWTELW